MLRRFSLALAAAFAAAAAWAACSGRQTASPGKDGGADAGNAGVGGGGSGGGTGGAGATGGSGGTGGMGGSPTDAGEWGSAPVWKGIPGTAVGCTYERMVNAAQVRMFKWQPCSWTAGCEQAVWNTDLFGPDASFIRTSVVVDDGTTVRAGLTMWRDHNIGVVVGADGMGMDAVRVTGGSVACTIGAVSVWKNRFAVKVSDQNVKHFGGILGKVGAMGTPPVVFSIPEPPPLGGSQQYVLGDSRWLWWWTPVDRFSTVSATDGSDFQIFAKAVGSVMEYAGPTTTGPLFLAEEFDQGDGGHVQGIISYSDGVSPMKPYLVPPDPNDDYGEPVFANSDVAFMRGIHQTGVNQYDSVEIWTTPYSTDPAQLKPEVLAAYSDTSMSSLAGGWGHVAIIEGPLGGPFKVAIWDIANKSARRYPLPADHFPNPMLGVTRTHFWLGGNTKGDDPYLMRFNIQ